MRNLRTSVPIIAGLALVAVGIMGGGIAAQQGLPRIASSDYNIAFHGLEAPLTLEELAAGTDYVLFLQVREYVRGKGYVALGLRGTDTLRGETAHFTSYGDVQIAHLRTISSRIPAPRP